MATTGNEQVRVEIQTFMQALASYTDRAALDPRITFEQHYISLIAVRTVSPKTSSRRSLHRHSKSHFLSHKDASI